MAARSSQVVWAAAAGAAAALAGGGAAASLCLARIGAGPLTHWQQPTTHMDAIIMVRTTEHMIERGGWE